jgi:hypothetical protein
MKCLRFFYGAMFVLTAGAVQAQSATIDEVIITPPSPDQNSVISVFVTGELGNACHRVLEQNLTINENTVALALQVVVDPATVCTAPDGASTVPFTVSQPVGILDEGEYTFEVTVNQGVATSSTEITVTEGGPDMTISPPTGRYVTGQTFDLAIIISGTDATVESGFVRFGPQNSAAWDWVDISTELLTCLIEGQLTEADSMVFLCRGVPTDLAGPGRFGVLASVVLSDGSVLTDLVTWEIRAAEGF